MPYTIRNLITTEGGSASYEKRLSICLVADGFSFAETTTDGVLLTFGEVTGRHAATMTDAAREVKSCFAEAGIRPLGYKQMELIMMSDESVWVPDELYSSLSNRQYMRLVGSEALLLMTCRSRELASTAVFAAAEHLAMAFKVALPGLVVINQHAKLASLAPCSVAHPVLVCHWRKGRVDVAALQDGRYIYGNTLSYRNADDALFHLVEVMKGYGLERSDTELKLCGDVDRDIYARMRPYFPSVTLYTGNHTSFLNPEFKSLHTYKNALIL